LKRLDFTLLNIICLISIIFLISTYSISFVKEQSYINEKLYNHYLKIIPKEKKESYKKEEKIIKQSFLLENIKIIIQLYRTNNVNIIPFLIKEKHPQLNVKTTVKLSNYFEKILNNTKEKTYKLVVSLFLIIILNFILFLMRKYNYSGKVNLILDTVIYLIPLSNLYFIIMKGRGKEIILNKNPEIRKYLKEVDIEKIESKYEKIKEEGIIKSKNIKEKIIILISNIPTIIWMKRLRPILKILNYIILIFFSINLISYMMIGTNSFLNFFISCLILELIFFCTMVFIDNIQYKKIMMLKDRNKEN